MSPQIEKQQFKNATQGWIGAVSIGPKGDEGGVAVEPGGTVWLSEAEQILTANAPRHAEDNPFIEQTHIVSDPETGARTETKVTPLVLVNEGRFVPANERPIPSDLAAGASGAVAQDAATGDEPVVPISADVANNAIVREQQIIDHGKATRPHEVPVPARAVAAAEAAASATLEELAAEPQPPAEPPTEPPADPQTPVEPQPVEEPPAPTFPTPAAPLPPAADPSRTVPPDEGRVEEETAVQSPGPESEETGAAVPPTGTAPQGEYQAGEEVGTPDAPAAADESAVAPSDAPAADAGQQPAPWTPETEG